MASFKLKRPVVRRAPNDAETVQDVEATDWSAGQRGWSVDIPAPPSNNGNNLVGSQPKYKSLIDTSLIKYGPLVGLGSYQVAVSAKALAPSPGGQATILPLLLKVQFGAGGAIQEFECDALDAIFSVPSDTLVIDAFWDVLPYTIPVGPFPWVPAVRAKATCVRAGQSYPARLTRSVWVGWNTLVSNAYVTVPPYAKGYRVYLDPQYIDDPVTDGWAVSTLNNGLLVDGMNSAQIKRYVQGLCYRPLPSGATQLWFNRANSLASERFRVEFVLGFGGEK